MEGPTATSERARRITEAYERLHQLEKRDRRNWIVLVVPIAVLSTVLLALTIPGTESLSHNQFFRVTVRASIAPLAFLVIWASRQQRAVARKRRELSSDLAVIAASETLNVAIGNGPTGVERRVLSRILCNEKLVVVPVASDGTEQLCGRILDLSEDGLGAIVPTVLSQGQHVILEFSLGDRQTQHPANLVRVEAIVRQRNGFRYGFSFMRLDDKGRSRISDYRDTGKVISIAVRAGRAE